VQPLKVIWLRAEGGLRTETNAPVPSVDLCRDAPHLVRSMADEYDGSQGGSAEEFDSGSGAPELDQPAARIAEACVEDLNLQPSDASCLVDVSAFHDVLREPGATVSVTAPEFLAQELFTHRGAGTLVTRGERVFAHPTLATVDLPRLYALLGAAFGAPLPAGYLERLATSGRLKRVYVTEEYRGAAVILHAEGGLLPASVSYLDKFAVDPSAQGDKLGEVLWKAMVIREPKLFWRSRSSNRVNQWYFSQSDGCFKADAATRRDGVAGNWTVFWRQLADSEVMKAVEQALSFPPTFALSGSPGDAADDKPERGPGALPTLK
jgi:acetylglutamate synthase